MVDPSKIFGNRSDPSGNSPQEAASLLLGREYRVYDLEGEEFVVRRLGDLLERDQIPELLFSAMTGSANFSAVANVRLYGPGLDYIHEDFFAMRDALKTLARVGRSDREFLAKGEAILKVLIDAVKDQESRDKSGINPSEAVKSVIMDDCIRSGKPISEFDRLLDDDEFVRTMNPNLIEQDQLLALSCYRHSKGCREALEGLFEGLQSINLMLSRQGPGQGSSSARH